MKKYGFIIPAVKPPAEKRLRLRQLVMVPDFMAVRAVTPGTSIGAYALVLFALGSNK